MTGGFVYRGDSLSPYYGKYFFADYCSDRIWTLHPDTTGWVSTNIGQFKNNNFSAFGEDYKGELYLAGHASGIIYKIAGQATNLPPEKEISGIQLFHDPLSRKIILELNQGSAREAIISIYDMQGAVRFSDRITDEKYEFSTGSLPYGIYLIHLRQNGRYWSQKLIIE